MPTPTKSAPERLDDAQVLDLAARYERAGRLEGRVKRIKQAYADQVIGELDLRKQTRLEGEDATVAKVQAVSYDEEALYGACDDAQRAALFSDQLDLNALPADVRAILVDLLDAEQRAAVTRHVLDETALDAALAARRIKAAVVRRCEKRGKPYIKVSHGVPTAPKRRR